MNKDTLFSFYTYSFDDDKKQESEQNKIVNDMLFKNSFNIGSSYINPFTMSDIATGSKDSEKILEYDTNTLSDTDRFSTDLKSWLKNSLTCYC